MVVEVEVKNVYGKELIYPVNDVAKKFAQIAGTTTLTLAVFKKIRELGCDVIITAPGLI